MIDDRTMGDLRMAATLVHALPGIVLRVDGARASHRVGHGVVDTDDALTPCAFRVAVVQAHHLREKGRPISLIGLCPAERPALTLSAEAGHDVLPGGICVVRDEEGWRVVIATLLPQEVCREVLLVAGAEPEDQVPLALHRDDATAVTLVHTCSDDDHLDLAVNAIEAALARCATAELLGDYAGIGSAQPP